jgi:hypothetical protein
MTRRRTRTPSLPKARPAIQAAYAAGQVAPRDANAATHALMAYCRDHGAEPGDPVADAWCCGWYEKRYATAH